MKAMIWKELRENARWAALGALVLTAAEFYILSAQRHDFGNLENANITVTNPNFLMVARFGCALVAACLGALQILPERPRDRWAALLHRPVSRGVIFGGKAIAGLTLYGVAVALPFLASVLYAAWPGTFPAPFVAALLLPGIQVLAGGAAFYAGALLLCLHGGRWFGARGALLLAVGAVFMLQQGATGLFLLLPLLTTAVLGLAAWEAMRGVRPGAGSAITVVVVWLGAQTGVLLLAIGAGLLPGAESSNIATYSRLEVTRDGQILKRTSRLDGGSMTVTDLDGRPVTDERYIGGNSYQYFCEFWPLSYQLDAPRNGYYYVPKNALAGISHVQRLELGNYARESWYLLLGRNYFVGYDNLSRRRIGICDREGFKPANARPVPFDHPLQGEHMLQDGPGWLWDGGTLYLTDFLERQATPFFAQPGSVILAAMQLPDTGSYETYHRVVVSLENEFRVLDEHGRLLFAHPYLHDPRVWSAVELATNTAGDRLYVQSQSGIFGLETSADPAAGEYLDELDMQGRILHSFRQPTAAVPPGPRWLTAVQTGALPLVPAGLDRLYRRAFPASLTREMFSVERAAEAIGPAGWLGLAGFSAALAVVAFAWARRAGFGARAAWGWAVFVFALGVAGLLAFRLASRWPQRVRCPVCGHLRGLDRERCPHCQEAWTAPPPTGTEIVQALVI